MLQSIHIFNMRSHALPHRLCHQFSGIVAFSQIHFQATLRCATKVFGALEPLSRFLAISPKQMQISTPNFQHPLSHQYHTLCENLKVQGIIGRQQMTSEWHNVPSIWTPPRTQFLSYDQLTYVACLRISRAIILLSRIFLILKIWKFKKCIFFLFKNFSLIIKVS